MSLRFAIIKHIKTQVGQEWEDVVYEYQAERVYEELVSNLLDAIPKKKWYQVLRPNEIEFAFKTAWIKTVNDFKKVTITIF
jgi:hypothetical protein